MQKKKKTSFSSTFPTRIEVSKIIWEAEQRVRETEFSRRVE